METPTSYVVNIPVKADSTIPYDVASGIPPSKPATVCKKNNGVPCPAINEELFFSSNGNLPFIKYMCGKESLNGACTRGKQTHFMQLHKYSSLDQVHSYLLDLVENRDNPNQQKEIAMGFCQSHFTNFTKVQSQKKQRSQQSSVTRLGNAITDAANNEQETQRQFEQLQLHFAQQVQIGSATIASSQSRSLFGTPVQSTIATNLALSPAEASEPTNHPSRRATPHTRPCVSDENAGFTYYEDTDEEVNACLKEAEKSWGV